MEQDILKKIEAQDQKLEEIYRSIEKMRKYFFLDIDRYGGDDCSAVDWAGVGNPIVYPVAQLRHRRSLAPYFLFLIT